MDSPDYETFTKDPSSLPYLFGPWFWIFFSLVFIIPRSLSPWLGRAIIPETYSKLGRNLSMFNCLLVSTFHAMLVSFFTLYILAVGDMGTTRAFSKSSLGFTLMQSSLGYFIGDFIACLLDKELRSDKSLLAHHVVSFLGIGLSLYHQGKCMFFVVYRFTNELSTPCVNLFWLLKITKRQQSTFFIVNSLLMILIFFLCRIAVIPWHWSVFMSTFLFDPAAALVPVFLQFWVFQTYVVYDVLNVWWVSKMVKGAYKYFSSSNKKDIVEKLVHD